LQARLNHYMKGPHPDDSGRGLLFFVSGDGYSSYSYSMSMWMDLP